MSYSPTGEIIVDNGFRPWVDGFGFENYGNNAGPQNLTADNMVDLFGVRVCENGDPKDCELTPTAAKWMEVKNERMAGGHCMGFSVIAEIWTFQDLPSVRRAHPAREGLHRDG